MSHSKRNTSRPVFTSHERALAKSNWSSNSARLNRDSFLPFGSCGLCLEIAREPISCSRGDIFCRECALANLLAQKKELKRAEKLRQDAEHELGRIKALEDEEDRERAVRDFEMTQAGLARASKHTSNDEIAESTASKDGAGTKRKFNLDEDELARIAKEDKVKARKAIEDDKASKPSLPSFWTPSLAPDAHGSTLALATKKIKSTPICPASAEDEPHNITMHKLITLNFEEDEDASTRSKRRICPSCRKELSNSSAPVVAKQCGHIFCLSCAKKVLLPSKSAATESHPIVTCYVCDSLVSTKNLSSDSPKGTLPHGLVSLRSEGTGFSSRGVNQVAKSNVAFQC